MRDFSAKEADLLVVWSGKIEGASGWMAGILEEVSFAIQYNKPLLILGGFGGCAQILADFLLDPEKSTWPPQLKLNLPKDADEKSLLTDAQTRSLSSRFDKIQQNLEVFRQAIHHPPRATSSIHKVNGISVELIKSALTEQNFRKVIRIVAQVAEAVKQDTVKRSSTGLAQSRRS